MTVCPPDPSTFVAFSTSTKMPPANGAVSLPFAILQKILLATSVINTKHADDFDYNCVAFFALKMNVLMIFTEVLGKIYF